MMFPLHGRWTVNYFITGNVGKTFNEIKETCQRMNSHVAFVKELRDTWSPDWIVKREGGPNKEMYIGLDPNSLPRACSANGWADSCAGLKWLDGTPFDTRIVPWRVETDGATSVGCFIITLKSDLEQIYIKGVNDCDVKRSASCISECMYQRCPIARELANSQNNGDNFKFNRGDEIRFEYLQLLVQIISVVVRVVKVQGAPIKIGQGKIPDNNTASLLDYRCKINFK